MLNRITGKPSLPQEQQRRESSLNCRRYLWVNSEKARNREPTPVGKSFEEENIWRGNDFPSQSLGHTVSQRTMNQYNISSSGKHKYRNSYKNDASQDFDIVVIEILIWHMLNFKSLSQSNECY